MTSKVKLQISRNLDDRIKRNIDGNDFGISEENFSLPIYITGFNYATVTNFVGLTKDANLHSGYEIVGLVYFKSSPELENIVATCKKIKSLISDHPAGAMDSFKCDKSLHLFLIYTFEKHDGETNIFIKRILDLEKGQFLDPQPKISVLDDSKIYSHSALTQVNISLKLDIFHGKSKQLLPEAKLKSSLESCMSHFKKDSKDLKIHLAKSSYSTNSMVGDDSSTETLYDHLDIPSDALESGDYLPQLSKVERQKLAEKWHNKIKGQRQPFEFNLEHEALSSNSSSSDYFYILKAKLYLYLHVNDPISKSLQRIIQIVRYNLYLVQIDCLLQSEKKTLGLDELKLCSFKPANYNHLNQLVYSAYAIPSNRSDEDAKQGENEAPVDYSRLLDKRKCLHQNHLVPMTRPVFRYSQRITSLDMKSKDEKSGYLCNVHQDILDKSGIKGGSRFAVQGKYTYHHYMQDKVNDAGWGCAYRSLQTIISWFKHQAYIYTPDVEPHPGCLTNSEPANSSKMAELRRRLINESRVPNHKEIQETLVQIGEKPASFIGSEKWIGSQEVFQVLNQIYGIEAKFIFVSSGGELATKAREFVGHFEYPERATPIMIGGGFLAHTIIGIDFNEKNGDISYLILDPHYTGEENSDVVTKKGWAGWKKNNFWDKSAFYNLCLPIAPNVI